MDKKLSDVVNDINSEDDLKVNPLEEKSQERGDDVLDDVTALIASQIAQSFKETIKSSPELDEQASQAEETLPEYHQEQASKIAEGVTTKLAPKNPFSGNCPPASEFDLDDKWQHVLNNEWEFCRQQVNSSSISSYHESNKELYEIGFLTTAKALQKYAPSHFVGVQPMSGPVGLVHVTKHNNHLDQQAIEAGTRKLQMSYTIEAAQDMKTFHGADLLYEFVHALTQEYLQEVWQEVSSDLLATKSIVETSVTTGRDIANAIYIESHRIAKRTGRNKANKIIASNAVISALIEADEIEIEDDPSKRYGFVSYVGKLDDMEVFCDPNFAKDSLVVGYKGEGETDAGYFLCPYVPVMPSGIVVHPTTFQPVASFMTRYGKAVRQQKDDKGVERSSLDLYYTKMELGDLTYTAIDDRNLTKLFKKNPLYSVINRYGDTDVTSESNIVGDFVDVLETITENIDA